MFFSTFYFWFTWVTLAREVVILNCILCTLLAGACTWCQPGKNVLEIQPNVVQLPCDTQTQVLLSLNQKHLYFQILLKYCHEVVSTEINNCFSNPNLTFSPQIQPRFSVVGMVSALRSVCACVCAYEVNAIEEKNLVNKFCISRGPLFQCANLALDHHPKLITSIFMMPGKVFHGSSETNILKYSLWSLKYEKAHGTRTARDSNYNLHPSKWKEINPSLSIPSSVYWAPMVCKAPCICSHFGSTYKNMTYVPEGLWASGPYWQAFQWFFFFFSNGSCGFYSFTYLNSGGVLSLFTLWQILSEFFCLQC